MYRFVKLLHRTPETNVTIYVTYTGMSEWMKK